MGQKEPRYRHIQMNKLDKYCLDKYYDRDMDKKRLEHIGYMVDVSLQRQQKSLKSKHDTLQKDAYRKKQDIEA